MCSLNVRNWHSRAGGFMIGVELKGCIKFDRHRLLLTHSGRTPTTKDTSQLAAELRYNLPG
jgi:hypothetical protein